MSELRRVSDTRMILHTLCLALGVPTYKSMECTCPRRDEKTWEQVDCDIHGGIDWWKCLRCGAIEKRECDLDALKERNRG